MPSTASPRTVRTASCSSARRRSLSRRARSRRSICAGGITRFTINVQNTGTTPLSVVAVDVLPAALSYNANVSNTCGGAVSPNGQTITFGPFDLAAGASCSISFDAKASADCFGQVTNVVDVTGTFNSACIKGGGLAATAHAEASVTCKAPPCVSAAAECNPAGGLPGRCDHGQGLGDELRFRG